MQIFFVSAGYTKPWFSMSICNTYYYQFNHHNTELVLALTVCQTMFWVLYALIDLIITIGLLYIYI